MKLGLRTWSDFCDKSDCIRSGFDCVYLHLWLTLAFAKVQFNFGAEIYLHDALHSWDRSGVEWKFFFEKENPHANYRYQEL